MKEPTSTGAAYTARLNSPEGVPAGAWREAVREPRFFVNSPLRTAVNTICYLGN